MVDDLDQDDFDSEAGERPPSILMELPDELAEWVDQNRELVTRVQAALTSSYARLDEDQIWEIVAASSGDSEWKKAQQDLRTAEMNAPLGAIGQALDSDETDSESTKFAFSLAHFTTINEGLRQRSDLSNLLNVLLVQKRMLNQSAGRTALVKKSADKLMEITSLRQIFKHAAKRSSRIQRQFRTSIRRLLGAGKETYTINVTVPWLPKI